MRQPLAVNERRSLPTAARAAREQGNEWGGAENEGEKEREKNKAGSMFIFSWRPIAACARPFVTSRRWFWLDSWFDLRKDASTVGKLILASRPKRKQGEKWEEVNGGEKSHRGAALTSGWRRDSQGDVVAGRAVSTGYLVDGHTPVHAAVLYFQVAQYHTSGWQALNAVSWNSFKNPQVTTRVFSPWNLLTRKLSALCKTQKTLYVHRIKCYLTHQAS